MFKEGNLLKFSPFIFKNGACPKNKFFVVLKEAENAMILASLPTSKDHVPADMQLKEGCMEIPDPSDKHLYFSCQAKYSYTSRYAASVLF